MMTDKRFGLNVNVLATKVLPSLTPAMVAPNMRMEEVRTNCELSNSTLICLS